MKPWWKSKAIWTGAGAVLAAAGGYLSGELDLANTAALVLAALQGIFIRTGMNVAVGKVYDLGTGK